MTGVPVEKQASPLETNQPTVIARVSTAKAPSIIARVSTAKPHGRGIERTLINRKDQYRGGITWRVMLSAFVAANSGLIYGYYIGVTGGAETFPSWQARFFPALLAENDTTSLYCKYDDQLLGLFTSSLFLAAAATALIGGWSADKYGRRASMMFGGCLAIIGIVLQCSAMALGQLIAGRVILGLGVGFMNQAAPMFLSEMAPFAWRGAINNMFQTATTLGIFSGQLATWQLLQYDVGGVVADGVTIVVSANDWDWRVAFGIAGIPALIITIGSFLLTDSPSGLVGRGYREEAQEVLKKIRGTTEIEAEYADTIDAFEACSGMDSPWYTICTPAFLPQLVISIVMPLGQQLPGIDSIMFYSPQIFTALGKNGAEALQYAVILSGSQFGATLVAVATVDLLGRRPLLIEGGTQMAIGIVACAGVLASTHGQTSVQSAQTVLALMVVFVTGFAWSWGPLGWLVPTEVQPLETRSAGMAITTAVSLMITFLNGQAFPAMLCGMTFGVFLYFGAWIIIFTLFVIFLLPETKGVPLEEVEQLFFDHWIWGRILHKVKAARLLEAEEEGEAQCNVVTSAKMPSSHNLSINLRSRSITNARPPSGVLHVTGSTDMGPGTPK